MPHSHPLSKRAGMRASKKRWLSAFFPISSLVERARVRLVAGYASLPFLVPDVDARNAFGFYLVCIN